MTELKAPHAIPIQEYWRMIRRRKMIILVFSAVVILSTIVGTVRQKKEYRATTTVHIDQIAPRVVEFEEPRGEALPRMSDYQAYYNTQFKIIGSRSVLQGTVRALEAKGYTDWKDKKNPVQAFKSKLEVNTIKKTRLVEISYDHQDPAKAAEIANTLANVYIRENLNRKVRAMASADEWLRERTQEWAVKMKESDERLLQYKKTNDLLSMQERESIFQRNLSEMHRIYNEARVDRIVAETEYQNLKRLYESGDYTTLVTAFSDPTARKLKEQLNDAEVRYESLSKRYLPKYPLMIQIEGERGALEQSLEHTLTALLHAKESEYKLRLSKEESLHEELERAKGEASALETKVVQARGLVNESERNQRFFKQLDERQTEVDLVRLLLLQNSSIEVIDDAVPPIDHVRPNFGLNMLLALLVSCVGGIGIGLGVEYFDKTFRSPEDLEQSLGVPLLGIFPSIESVANLPQRDTYVYHNPKSSAAECVRSIRTNIMLGAQDRKIRSLLVTSASPREGKSTLAASLGVTMALANNRTLLVDTDLRRPRLHQVFGVALEAGLTSLVSRSIGHEAAVFKTEVPNLFFMPSGPIPTNPSELLGSARMEEVIEELQEHFDLVIFDSPPCIAVTDAVVLSTKVDGVIFVIKQNSTTKEAALEAKRRLGEIGENLLGCIMNNVEIERDAYGYRYYYYYHYYGDESNS